MEVDVPGIHGEDQFDESYAPGRWIRGTNVGLTSVIIKCRTWWYHAGRTPDDATIVAERWKGSEWRRRSEQRVTISKLPRTILKALEGRTHERCNAERIAELDQCMPVFRNAGLVQGQ